MRAAERLLHVGDTTSLQGVDRSPESLAVVLASAAERVRTDPEANFAHGAVRGAAQVLAERLGARLARHVGDGAEAARGHDDTEGP